MIRPFGLRDVIAVRRLQRHGVWLDHYHYLIQRRSALATALISPVPWLATGLASYVWVNGQRVQGFVQMLRRPGKVAADLLYLAPGLDRQPTADAAWHYLLTFCLRNAGGQGVRRLFASVAVHGRELEPLAKAGFANYTRESVFSLSRAPRESNPLADQRIRPLQPEDAWWLRRLYNLYTPSPVQHAEASGEKEDQTTSPMMWWELSHEHGYVLADQGEVCGGVQVISGRRGHWLVLYGDPGHTDRVSALVRQGLAAIANSRWPVYCAVRDYQGGLAAVLEDHGFRPLMQRSRLVKHLAVAVRAAEPATVPGLAIEQSG